MSISQLPTAGSHCSRQSRWLAANLDMPLVVDPPRIVFESPSVIAALPFKARLSDEVSDASDRSSGSAQAQQSAIVALYGDTERTIYLPKGWSGRTPAELSILVHEMAHHIQHVSRLYYGCPEAREQLAFAARDRWLRLFALATLPATSASITSLCGSAPRVRSDEIPPQPSRTIDLGA